VVSLAVSIDGMGRSTVDPSLIGSDIATVTHGAVAVVLSTKGSQALSRLLGPAWDELAESLRRFTAYRLGNIEKIAELATSKYEGSQEGAISPRVALRLLEEGSYSDDEVVLEYLSGVLASSRTPDGRDDRGVPWTALISRLSSDQLRLHYVLYSAARRAIFDYEPSTPQARSTALSHASGRLLFLPSEDLASAFDWSPDIDEDESDLARSAIVGLQREGLLGDYFATGPGDFLSRNLSRTFPPRGGLVFQISTSGVALFLWGHGRGRAALEMFLDPAQQFALVGADLQVTDASTTDINALPSARR
jgi:hypothetical protein